MVIMPLRFFLPPAVLSSSFLILLRAPLLLQHEVVVLLPRKLLLLPPLSALLLPRGVALLFFIEVIHSRDKLGDLGDPQIGMSHSRASSSRWTSVNEELEHIIAHMPNKTVHCLSSKGNGRNWHTRCNMSRLHQRVSSRRSVPRTRFSVKLVRYMLPSGRTYLAVYDIWLTRTEIITICGSTSHRRRVDNIARLLPTDRRSSHIAASLFSMYYFLKDKGWTHLHLGDVAECRLVFNHWRKSLKIEAEWKYLCETFSFTVDMEIVFEFIDLDVNRVLYWPCL
ncbi:hypothetical protein GmHk_03G006365 [Glycine max]|nr:hypothetical protein GmHk_03G006365 [Glycine max]